MFSFLIILTFVKLKKFEEQHHNSIANKVKEN